ncbi:hypothetical protein R3P38DRAFT_2499157 [Favolaschia claudopus]|uniref:C2H2-type domain-containing protein n=1 Tax=Favolaschia claudopus TaxID=2862362 RepID=A0AAW0DSZ0_9AGAR
MTRGKCPRVPALPVIDVRGNYSHPAYAIFLFGGGHCTGCSKYTEKTPFSWFFRFRSCSAACNKLLMSGLSLFADKEKKYQTHPFGSWLPRMTQFNPHGQDVFLYSRTAIKNANLEQQQAFQVEAGHVKLVNPDFPRRNVEELNAEYSKRGARATSSLYLQHAFEIQSWQPRYTEERASIRVINRNYIELICRAEERKLQGVMRCPTMAKLFEAFNRDLQLITFTVWMHNRDDILNELNSVQNGILPAGTTARNGDKIRCAYCPRLISVRGMANHVVDKHPNASADTIPFIPARKEKHCPLCSGSKRVYSQRGLKDHKLVK